MKRREFNKNFAAAVAVIQSPFSLARIARGATTGGGATPVFSYPNGFAGSSGNIIVSLAAGLHGSNINLITDGQGHNHGVAWYAAKQPPSAFTTQFTFSISGQGLKSPSQTVGNPGVFTTDNSFNKFQTDLGVMITGAAPGGFSLNTIYYIVSANLTQTTCSLAATPGGTPIACTSSVACTLAYPEQSGLTFCIQNTSSGTSYGGDANMCGYGDPNNPTNAQGSIAIKFDASNMSQQGYYPSIFNYPAGFPSSTGIYFNGAPHITGGSNLGLVPYNDLGPNGINFYTGNVHQATIVYDGSLLTLVILDTVTHAQARLAWPLNLANTTNSTGNYVGFTAGTQSVGTIALESWQYWSGYNTRLATPTFSLNAGNFPSAQSVTINYPPGSTCYYTTNGLLPTSSSTQYNGPITVSANTVLQAVAIEPGFTDSLVATANYVIGASSNVINFPSGFVAGNLLSAGYAYLKGSAYLVSDGLTLTSGAVWFPAPVTVSTFSTTFTLFWSGSGQGMCFVIQNSPQPYATQSNALNVGGGPTIASAASGAMGYSGIGPLPTTGILNSIAVAFNQYAGSDPGNSVGLYLNGVAPTGLQLPTGLNFAGGTFKVTLTYDGTTLALSMQSIGGGTTYTHSWPVAITSLVGANTAYVGFTGGTGGAATTQAIQSWIYSASQAQSPAVPAPPTNLRIS